ncbi:general L-amino acid transport system substrate-binding protein [Rhizobiales bacterium GAS191]|jgi:general L-amino acid transport system substrate-binding protein|nr:general L-amino acid transport system substrate-binding protein [Rhizobiales bacterium GAS113]SED70663.1 general L-amino acid transport system substrate-binding protein [Rhizobiales bacterium GAS188]SEE82001.1 general L-amino acid transport system substrate-binding protein [Rhizobiales bacterium GAS191]
MKRCLLMLLAGLAVGTTTLGASAQTLEQVKGRGQLLCGVNVGFGGFALPDAQGKWTGLEVDYCRAIASAVLGDASKVKYLPLDAASRFEALKSGGVDVLIRSATWTLSRDSSQGLDFEAVYYYDGQGFMVRKSTGIKALKELDGASICVAQGSTTELNLADYFRANKMKYEGVAFKDNDETVQAYAAGRCDAYTTDASGLAFFRQKLEDPNDHVILPEIISKEPLASVVRKGDSQWATIVRWVHFAMLDAEENGVNSRNVDEMTKSTNPEVKRMLGVEGKFGEGLGIGNDWVVNIVRQVGNYGEVFDRNVGASSPLNLPRGRNNLWTKGGLQYAPPIR